MINNCDPHVLCAEERTVESGIVLDVDLEVLIRESERLRICEALFQSCAGKNWELHDMLAPIIGVPRVLTVPDTPPEADHAE